MGLSLVVCDQIIEDKLTGKKTLVGLFSRISAAKLPCIHPTMSVFVSMTGGQGEYPCEVLCRHADGEPVVFSAKGKVTLRDPQQVVDLAFRLNGVRFPRAGMYWVNFLIDEVPLMMRPLFLLKRPPPVPGGDKGKEGDSA